ncbi:MAG: hypothetical protein JWN70_829 [Planctomycetaceae bacterium]|nr:hypothetical protein [Planctomycetaceae bacterium]
MARRALSWALVLIVAWAVRPAVAQTASPLKAIPSDVAVVVRVKGFQGTLNKIASLADAVQPGTGQTVKFGGAAVGAVLKNPTMEGVDLAGDFYLAVFVEKGEAPGMVFIVPAKDMAAMEEALGDDVTFVKGDKHGIYSDDEELATSIKDQLKSKEKDSLADEIDEKSLAALNRGDISVFVNVPALLEAYKDELQMAHGLLGNLKDQVPETETPGINTAALLEKVQGIATTLLKAVEDHEGITLAIAFTDKDVVIEEYFALDDESDTGKALKASTGTDTPLINSLPADAIGYFAVQGDLSKLMACAMDFAEAIITDEEASKAIKSAATELKGIKFGGVAGAVNLAGGDEGGSLRILSLIAVDKPEKLRALTKKYSEAIKELEANGTKTEVTYKADAEKVGKTSIDLVTAKITISDDAPQAEHQRALMKAFYGEDGMESRTAYLADKIVQTVGGGAKAMEDALKAVTASSRTPSASLSAVKAKLGTKPNFVGLIDVASLVVKGLGMAKEIAGDDLPFPIEKLTKGLSLKPSYLGFGIEIQDAAVSIKTVIPADQIKSLVQMGLKAQAIQNGGGEAEEEKPEEKPAEEKKEEKKTEKKSVKKTEKKAAKEEKEDK